MFRRSFLTNAVAAATLAVAPGATSVATARENDAPGFHGMAIDHAMLGVYDMDRAVRWYREALGFEVEKAWTVEALPGVRLAYLTGDGFRLELVTGGGGPRAPVPATFAELITMRGYQHPCLRVDDVDAAVTERALGGVPTFVPATDYPQGAEKAGSRS